jgi:hypothetical protein
LAQYYVFEWQKRLPERDSGNFSIGDLHFPKPMILSPLMPGTRFSIDFWGAMNVGIRHSLSEEF